MVLSTSSSVPTKRYANFALTLHLPVRLLSHSKLVNPLLLELPGIMVVVNGDLAEVHGDLAVVNRDLAVVNGDLAVVHGDLAVVKWDLAVAQTRFPLEQPCNLSLNRVLCCL